MAHHVVAIFACSVLSVSLTLPALARDAEGVIDWVDEDGRKLVLTDGRQYHLPETLDPSALQPGMQIHLLYETPSDDGR